MNDIELGLGLWQGVYRGCDRQWLRWYDATGNWVLTFEETAGTVEQERQRADKEKQRAERLAEQLRALGVEPDIDDEIV